MQYALLLGAVILLSGKVEAAPKASDEQVVAHIIQGRGVRPDPHAREWVHSGPGPVRSRFHFNGTNTTTPTNTGTAGTASSTYRLPYNTTSSTFSRPSDCPLSVITSTTTVDVTFYITATTSYGGNFTSSSGTGTVFPPSSSQIFFNSTTSRIAWSNSSASVHLSTGYTLPVNSSRVSTTVASTAGSELPCSDGTTSTHLPHSNITSNRSRTHPSSFLVTGSSSDGYDTTTSVPAWQNTTSVTFPRTTEPCDDVTSSTSRLNSTAIATSTYMNSTASLSTNTPTSTVQETTCDEETRIGTGVTNTYTSTAQMDHTSSHTIVSFSSPHINSTATHTLSTQTANETPSQTVSVISSSLINSTSTHVTTESTTAAEPSEDVSTTIAFETSTAMSSSYSSEYSVLPSSSVAANSTYVASSLTQTTLSSSWTTQVYTVTPFFTSTPISAVNIQTATSASNPSVPTESCVIDTSMVPVTSAPLSSVPASTLVPTKTVCQDDAPTGKPKPGNNHCGVHGLPVGNYFIARFVENAPSVPVTLEGCYQFCASVMNATDGCKAYRFYPESGLNVPRCDLYGSNVAYALDSIDNDHPDLWFDLACGSPSDERWTHLPGMARRRELGLS